MKRIHNFVLLFLSITVALLPSFYVVSYAKKSNVTSIGYYELEDNQLHINGNIDFSKISEMDNIKSINIENAIIDEPIVIDSTELSSLSFTNCYFDTDRLESNTSQDIFCVSFLDCDFDDLEILSGLTAITDLNFWKCRIDSLKGIEKLNSLRCLSLGRTGIESIEELRAFDSFDYLELSGSSIKDISPLEGMSIKYLSLSDSMCIESLEPIMQIKGLSTLGLQSLEMLLTEEIVNFVKQNVAENDIAADWLKVQKQVKNIAREILSEEWLDNKKISAVAVYVANNMEYDYNIETDDDLLFEYNAHALRYALQGIGSCKNFATLITVLLQEAGINVYEVFSDNHVWNMVELDGTYYWIDGTTLPGLTEKEFADLGIYMSKEYDYYGYQIYPIPSSACDIVCKNFPDRLTQIKAYWLENSEMLEEKVETTEDENMETTEDENIETTENNDVENNTNEEVITEKKGDMAKEIFIVICLTVILVFVIILMKVIQKKRQN